MKIDTKGELRGILYNFKYRYSNKEVCFEYKDVKYYIFMGESERGVLTGYHLSSNKMGNYFRNKEELIKYVFNTEEGRK